MIIILTVILLYLLFRLLKLHKLINKNKFNYKLIDYNIDKFGNTYFILKNISNNRNKYDFIDILDNIYVDLENYNFFVNNDKVIIEMFEEYDNLIIPLTKPFNLFIDSNIYYIYNNIEWHNKDDLLFINNLYKGKFNLIINIKYPKK